MLRKTILITGSAVMALCGAMTAAHAGELKLKLRDVNVNRSHDDSKTEHIDTNLGNDLNGTTGINTGGPSVDKPFDGLTHVKIAEERMGGQSNPIGGWYEIDIFEVEGLPTFTPVTGFEFELGGDVDAWFKEKVNCAAALRAGSDNVLSGPANGTGFNPGENTAICSVTTTQGPSVVDDSAIGWRLPIEIKNCVDGAELLLKVTVYRQNAFPTLLPDPAPETITHPIAQCKDSIKTDFGGKDVKIDYYTDFTSFLVGENHRPDRWANVGMIVIDLHHNLVDLKSPKSAKHLHHSVFDVSDIETWDLTFQFDNLRGIQNVCLHSRCADVMDYDLDQARFSLTNSQIRSMFDISAANGHDKGGKTIGTPVWINIHAFPENSTDTNAGPIDHQVISIVENAINLTPTECTAPHCVKFFSPEREDGGDLAELKKTGINFGPFDWVAQPSALVKSYFRVTGIPKETVPDVKGLIIVENASNGKQFDGSYKVDFPDHLINNHELMLTPQMIGQILADGGMPSSNWGRADLSFTFFVGKEGLKMDMDRLLFTDGTFAPYGDNANDANSLKSRSCDDGRFGPHVANKLDPRFVEHRLVRRCFSGDIRDR